MNRNVDIRYAGYLICDPSERVVQLLKGVATHRMRMAVLEPGMGLVRKRAPKCGVCAGSHSGVWAVWKCNILPHWVVNAPSQRRSCRLPKEMLKMIKAFETSCLILIF